MKLRRDLTQSSGYSVACTVVTPLWRHILSISHKGCSTRQCSRWKQRKSCSKNWRLNVDLTRSTRWRKCLKIWHSARSCKHSFEKPKRVYRLGKLNLASKSSQPEIGQWTISLHAQSRLKWDNVPLTSKCSIRTSTRIEICCGSTTMVRLKCRRRSQLRSSSWFATYSKPPFSASTMT